MKTTRNITKAVVLMSLVTVGVMVVVMKGKVELSPAGEGKSQGQEVAAVEVLKEGKVSVSKEKAPEGLGIVAVEEVPAVQAVLEMAEPNDLVLVFADNVTRCWKQIIYFGRDPAAVATASSAPAEPVPPDDLPPLEDLGQMPMGATLIRDERGVRLAREPEEAD